MKIWFYVLLLTCALAILIGFTAQNDPGQVLFAYGDSKFETNLVIFISTIVIGFVISMLVLKFISIIKNFIRGIFIKRKERLAEKARHNLVQGLIDLAEGRFEKAEKILLQKVDHNEYSLLTYLAAARAAQQQGAYDRRDNYLQLAHDITPDADMAIGLTKAELQLAHNQLEQALATLNHLYGLSPKHAFVLKLLAETHLRLSDWSSLRNLIPDLKKHEAVLPNKIYELEIMSWNGLLSDSAKPDTAEKLIEAWNEMPKRMKVITEVLEHYSKLLVTSKNHDAAEKALRFQLEKNWAESTIKLYSELDGLSDDKQMSVAESWLQDHQQNEYLLLTLGKMCIEKQLWGKARGYLDASISVHPLPQTYLVLAKLLEEHMNEPELAQEYYRQGLHVATGAARLLADHKEIKFHGKTRPALRII